MTLTPVNCFQAKIVFEVLYAKICQVTVCGGVAKRFTPTLHQKIEPVKMLRYRNFSRFVTVLATLTFVSHGNVERLQTYLRSDTESHAQFVVHHARVLGIPPITSVQVQDSMLCLV